MLGLLAFHFCVKTMGHDDGETKWLVYRMVERDDWEEGTTEREG